MAQTLKGGSGLLLIPQSVMMPCQACRMPAGTIQLSNIKENLAGFPLAFLNMHAICFYKCQATWRGKAGKRQKKGYEVLDEGIYGIQR